jgi:hypothetical protein
VRPASLGNNAGLVSHRRIVFVGRRSISARRSRPRPHQTAGYTASDWLQEQPGVAINLEQIADRLHALRATP